MDKTDGSLEPSLNDIKKRNSQVNEVEQNYDAW